MDFDLNKQLENGLSFKKIFIELIIFSVSLFLAFSWSDLFKETVKMYMPEGTNLLSKFIIQVFMTIFFVLLVYGLTKAIKSKSRTVS